jgi:hypothetical protein
MASTHHTDDDPPIAARVKALEAILTEKGLVDRAAQVEDKFGTKMMGSDSFWAAIMNATNPQFERLVGELTWWHPTRWIHVPRAGAESRFIPVKDLAELERSGAAIRAVIDARLRDP